MTITVDVANVYEDDLFIYFPILINGDTITTRQIRLQKIDQKACNLDIRNPGCNRRNLLMYQSDQRSATTDFDTYNNDLVTAFNATAAGNTYFTYLMPTLDITGPLFNYKRPKKTTGAYYVPFKVNELGHVDTYFSISNVSKDIGRLPKEDFKQWLDNGHFNNFSIYLRAGLLVFVKSNDTVIPEFNIYWLNVEDV